MAGFHTRTSHPRQPGRALDGRLATPRRLPPMRHPGLRPQDPRGPPPSHPPRTCSCSSERHSSSCCCTRAGGTCRLLAMPRSCGPDSCGCSCGCGCGCGCGCSEHGSSAVGSEVCKAAGAAASAGAGLSKCIRPREANKAGLRAAAAAAASGGVTTVPTAQTGAVSTHCKRSAWPLWAGACEGASDGACAEAATASVTTTRGGRAGTPALARLPTLTHVAPE